MAHNTSSFGAINSHNALVGNHFLGPANITFHAPQDHSRPRSPAVYRSIPFPPNEDLVHRSDVARELDRLLPPTSDYQTAALWGLGGSGKTQIALAYAYARCRDLTCSVFWVHADTEASFTKDYQSIARKLSLPANLDGEDLLRAVRERIEEITNWVLVLDNADDLTLFGVTQSRHSSTSESKLNLKAFIPWGPTGTILWTSRDRQIEGSLVAARRAINIVQMTFEEAETLLDKIKNETAKEYEHYAVKKLLTELGFLPLAVSQAAAYMRRTSTSVEDYLSLIRSSKGRILGRSEHDQHRREQVSNSVLETWDISVQHLRKENELTYDVFHSLAFVDNQNIPFELIREAARRAKRTTLPSQPRNDSKESDNNEDRDREDDDYHDTMAVITRLCEFSFLSIRASDQNNQKKA
ncbi:P-loop containing nucleoside triphosphate hydrolase protein [Xylaria acuta]|nr:P-loop containing nucleoside triphosphate hydrolase protein [Xylaria acuta]